MISKSKKELFGQVSFSFFFYDRKNQNEAPLHSQVCAHRRHLQFRPADATVGFGCVFFLSSETSIGALGQGDTDLIIFTKELRVHDWQRTAAKGAFSFLSF